MARHVAILLRPYIRLILNGVKTVESRLTITRRAPFGEVAVGDVIHFKASSGPYMAQAVADAVRFEENLTPAKVDALRKRYDRQVCGQPEYWQAKRMAKYATFIKLRDVKATAEGPALPPSQGLAWFVLPELIEYRTALSAGAVRNRYVMAPEGVQTPATLVLPDGTEIIGELAKGSRRLKWRGWLKWLRDQQLIPGDQVVFTPAGPGRYNIRFVTGTGEASS
ncbi:MAG: hypothetical protein IT440_06920 [Phycisphaeraceae bacterium]|nr:hypothetical protein [Phycisphaeraceae bacterium]